MLSTTSLTVELRANPRCVSRRKEAAAGVSANVAVLMTVWIEVEAFVSLVTSQVAMTADIAEFSRRTPDPRVVIHVPVWIGVSIVASMETSLATSSS